MVAHAPMPCSPCSIQAKGYYLKTGLRKMMKKGGLKDFTRDIVLEVDGRRIDLPSLEGIVIMNILRYGEHLRIREIMFRSVFAVGRAAPTSGATRKTTNSTGLHITTAC